MSITTLIWFIFVFCIIVVSHEFGHMIVAKMNGIQVDEFSIGMGPKIWGFHKNGTFYVLRWLPLGGACIFGGMTDEDIIESIKKDKHTDADNEENDDTDNSDDEEYIVIEDIAPEGTGSAKECIATDEGIALEKKQIKFKDAPVWARISTVLAGPLFNFILAYLLALVIVWFCGSDKAVIGDLMEGYPAAESGLQAGDVITKINGSRICVGREVYVNTFVNKDGEPMEVTYERDGKEYTTVIVPKYYEEEDRYLMGLNDYMQPVDCRNASVFLYSAYEVRYGLVATTKSLQMLFTGKGSKDDVAGPIGMAKIIGDVEEVSKPYGFSVVLLNMINIAMLLSINLGVMNLLPIPAIDGGRLIFLLIEVVRGKPVPPDKEGIVHLAGFALLFAFMIFVMFNDIMRFMN